MAAMRIAAEQDQKQVLANPTNNSCQLIQSSCMSLEHSSVHVQHLWSLEKSSLWCRICCVTLKFDTDVQAFAMPCQQKAWTQIHPPQDLGLDCGTYKWSQSQTEVYVFVPLPHNIRRHEVGLQIPGHL